MNLVIVESPTKAKTISRFLPASFRVVSSYGHVRDLPKSNLGIDVEKDFKPKYVIPTKAKKVVATLKKDAKNAKEIILATDEDREGEAIAWHLAQVLQLGNFQKSKFKNSKPYTRIVFHEVTKSAINNALKDPREININLVDAQQARRILDRLVGYKLSPFLWKKVRYGLSAGRVQSVALRLICEREQAVKDFKPREFWSIAALLIKKEKGEEFIATLIKKDGKSFEKLEIKNKAEAAKILDDLKNAEYRVLDITKKQVRRFPAPPFITSSLQQEAARKFGFSAKKTMVVAQQLYEGVGIDRETTGLITYMRTDSTNLSSDALKDSQAVIEQKFGLQYSLAGPRFYKTKSKMAQEAHEAIRPTSLFRFPEKIKNYLSPEQFKLYDLIWKRTLASQAKEAELESKSCDIGAKNYIFRANGSTIIFDGFARIYTEGEENASYFKETLLPELAKNDVLALQKITPEQHFTEPAGRYSEATLIKALEENGIGRPSTYAPTMSTILERGYVQKQGRNLIPTEVGILVNNLLVAHFPKIVDLKFTAEMENKLDMVAEAQTKWQAVMKEFYGPFEQNLKLKEKEVAKYEEKTDKICPKCGKPLIIKFGRFGKFLSCSNFPECKHIESLTKPTENEKTDKKCPKCGAKVILKIGKFGKFFACSKYPECKYTAPITLGIKCPECKTNELVERKSKFGKPFYGCAGYPKCKFALWSKPTGELCPKCKSLLVYGKNNIFVCSKKECGFSKPRTTENHDREAIDE